MFHAKSHQSSDVSPSGDANEAVAALVTFSLQRMNSEALIWSLGVLLDTLGG
jgi:hypothetical protein